MSDTTPQPISVEAIESEEHVNGLFISPSGFWMVMRHRDGEIYLTCLEFEPHKLSDLVVGPFYRVGTVDPKIRTICHAMTKSV
ncbi:hypothetical protein [Roseospira navarrensis]|uniref:Uncharacterized protein n=1 Tax=Roseospira navarrensis TaxID=140058 RepID=A0A7X1ZHE3_9PROT|nr:hypothetical protein [Roseospira navarrensis]MQX38576.1 hypothetical protein [Roseospira navarrensis]